VIASAFGVFLFVVTATFVPHKIFTWSPVCRLAWIPAFAGMTMVEYVRIQSIIEGARL